MNDITVVVVISRKGVSDIRDFVRNKFTDFQGEYILVLITSSDTYRIRLVVFKVGCTILMSVPFQIKD